MLSYVLMLTGVVGRDVLGPDRTVVGRLADLTVRLDDGAGEGAEQRVRRLLVTRRGRPTLLLPTEVVVLQGGRVLARTADLEGFRIAGPDEALQPAEILLRRDVLDTQVVDVVGRRLARVAEVLLARTPDAGLAVAGVEVGFAGVLRRLRLTRGVPAGRADMVAWSDLHLTSERGHAVQLSTPRATVHRLDPRGLAALVSRVDVESASEILTAVLTAREPAVAAEALRVAHPDVVDRVLRAMPRPHVARIFAAMSAEHAEHWRSRLARAPGPPRRRYLRSPVWSRRHLNWHPSGDRR